MNRIFRNTLLVFFILFSNLSKAELSDPAHEQEILSMEYSPSGRYLVTGGRDLKIRLWDSKTGQMLYAKDVEFFPLKIFISPNEKYLILTQTAGKNNLYDLKNGEKIKELMIEEVAGFTNDSKSIITISHADDGKEKYVSLGFADLNDESFISYFSYSRIYATKPLKAPAETKKGHYLLLADHSNEIYLFKRDSVMNEEKIKIDRKAAMIRLLQGDSSFIINGSSKYYLIKTGKGADFLEEPTFSDENATLVVKNGKIINYNSISVKIYNSETGKIIFRQDLSPYKLSAINPDGYSFAYTTGEKLVVEQQNFNSQEKPLAFIATDIIEKIAFQNYQKAVYFINKGKYVKARDLLSMAEKKSKRLSKVYYLLGETYLQMGFSEDAIRYFLMDHAVAPRRAAYKIAQGFASTGDAETALRWLDTAALAGKPINAFEIEKDPFFDSVKTTPVFEQRLNLLRKRESEQYVKMSMDRSGNKEDLAALEYLSKAIVSDQNNARLYKMRAKLYLKLKEYDKARLDYLKEAAIDSLDKAQSFFNIALTYSRTGDMNNTITWIRKGISNDSTYLGSLTDIAELYESAYRRDIAINILNDYLKFVPIDHYAVYLRASMMPVPETAIAEMKRAIELAKEQGDQVPAQYTELLQSLATTARK